MAKTQVIRSAFRGLTPFDPIKAAPIYQRKATLVRASGVKSLAKPAVVLASAARLRKAPVTRAAPALPRRDYKPTTIY